MLKLFPWPEFINGIYSIKCDMLRLPPLCATAPATAPPDTENNPDWYCDTSVHYPLDETMYSLQHPQFFKSKCELSLIINEVGKTMFDDAGNRVTQPSEQALQKLLTQLGAWKFSLPPKLNESHVVFPFELNLQSVLHLDTQAVDS